MAIRRRLSERSRGLKGPMRGYPAISGSNADQWISWTGMDGPSGSIVLEVRFFLVTNFHYRLHLGCRTGRFVNYPGQQEVSGVDPLRFVSPQLDSKTGGRKRALSVHVEGGRARGLVVVPGAPAAAVSERRSVGWYSLLSERVAPITLMHLHSPCCFLESDGHRPPGVFNQDLSRKFPPFNHRPPAGP